MKISIVVPAFNEAKLLPRTLEAIGDSLEAFEQLGWGCERIVSDNNSTDGTAEIARASGAHVIFEPLNQISRARNSGAAAATGDWLLFIDADSSPTPALFADMAGAIQNGGIAGGGSTLRMNDGAFTARLAVRGWNFISRAGKLLAGSFIFCETALFRELGGFSESLYAGEELDFAFRLKKLAYQRGRRIVILSRHPLSTSARKARLYTYREHFHFFSRTILGAGKTLRDPKACSLWYDGRR
jgi:glycosyltransferase involved in cell wall biosynthesis